jgi:hemerythrin superfamily protein
VDAIETLEHDHRMVEQLFRDYAAAASEQQRKGVVDIVVRELSKHAALEELLVYPLAKQVLPDGGEEIDHHLREHATVKRLLAELDGMSPRDERMDGLVRQLEREVHEHVQEEEGEMLPRFRQHLDQEALDELGAALDEGKKTAPTRPHPAAPDEPPALALAGPVAAIYDRLRDRLQGRPPT